MFAARRAAGEVVDDGSVELWPENLDTAQVYLLTRNQVVSVGMGGVVDLSIPAVKIVMDLLGVQDQRTTLLRVMRLFDAVRAQHEAARP